MKNMKYLLWAALIMLVACNKEPNEGDDLDSMLDAALVAAAEGQGRSFFKMPESEALDQIPQDPKNPLTPEKVMLGQMLFHETALATSPKSTLGAGTYSCASCHHAQGGFQACLPQGIGEGGTGFGENGSTRVPRADYEDVNVDVQPLRSPTAMNGAYQENMLWNGQFGATGDNANLKDKWDPQKPTGANFLGFEGVETQAIAGLKVHGLTMNEEFLMNNPIYRPLFDEIFAGTPEQTRYSNLTAGLAIAAFERTLLANQAPFQKWLNGDQKAMNELEKQGAILFFDKANCVSCHTGPALNSMAYYALGMNDLDGGNVIGYDPADVAHQGRGGFSGRESEMYAFKVPQLYNLKDSPFYGHGGNFHSVYEVVDYKNKAVPQNSNVPADKIHEGFEPQNLTEEEVNLISIFIEDALRDGNLMRYVPDVLPSEQCFPNNDPQSKEDLDCGN